MNYVAGRELIESHKGIVNFGIYGCGVSHEWVEKAQQRLEIRFPPSFFWWPKSYSGGEINGDEIFSIYELDFDKVVGGDLVYRNELYREKGIASLQQLFIQVNDLGEEYYIDLAQVNCEGESPVIVTPPGIKYADDFLHFLKKKILEP